MIEDINLQKIALAVYVACTCSPCSPGYSCFQDPSYMCPRRRLDGSNNNLLEGANVDLHVLAAGLQMCTACHPGWYDLSRVGSDASCTACAAGQYSAASAAIDCLACDAGTYSASSGVSACLACAPGTTSNPGSTACTNAPVITNCNPGQYLGRRRLLLLDESEECKFVCCCLLLHFFAVCFFN